MNALKALIPVAILLTGYAQASAAPSYATPVTPLVGAPHMGATVATPRGLGVVTGSFGSTMITSLPGSGGEGMLMDNGNGTSTFIGSGGPLRTVPAAR